MSRLDTALQNDLKLLKLLRDELALQSHLFAAEVKDRWQALETQWAQLENKVQHAESAAGESAKDAETAIGMMVDALKTGYANVKSALKH
jgi:D-ribose pyranose/furanose isomerase RbsD